MIRPKLSVFVSAGLMAAILTAPTSFFIVLSTAATGIFDGDALAETNSTALETAWPYGVVCGCYALALAPLLVVVRPYWAGVLIMMYPFAIPVLLGLLAGKPLDSAVMILICTATGLIARISANSAVARSEGG